MPSASKLQKIPEQHFARHIVAFGRVLRRAGLQVSTGQIMDALRALQAVGIRRRDDVYQAFHSIFVTRREQLEIFDQAFTLFWRAPSQLAKMMERLLPSMELPQPLSPKTSLRVRQAMAEPEQKLLSPFRQSKQVDKPGIDFIFTYSPVEVLRKKDFTEFSTEEIVQAKRLIAKMQWLVQPRRSRRRVPDDKGRLLDFRRTIRHSLRHHGEFVALSWHGHCLKPRPIILLCDISGSMERYSRMLLHFMHAITEGMNPVETFVFATRLTRITHYLKYRDVDEAVSAVSQAVKDWAGGTQIGEALKDFNYLWARRVLRNSPVVMVISDGWDRGNIPLLEREIARLSRSCHRLIWLNPLLGYEDYEPLTQGMKAAVPFIDDFLPVHNLESLEQLGELLRAIKR